MITWDEFWGLVATLDGRAEHDRCARLSAALARRPVHEITGFGERLAEALERLDREEFGLLPVTGMGSPDDPFPQSADGARAGDRPEMGPAHTLLFRVLHQPGQLAAAPVDLRQGARIRAVGRSQPSRRRSGP